MIGFFDSGFGGLQTMKDFQELYPEYNYIFLADSKNCPFGNKEGETIKELTFKGLHRLFDQGAKVVILACNTAAAYSIRSRQSQYPDKKVLSITIPGVEKILHSEYKKQKVGILATQATILSNIYTDLFFKFGGKESPDFEFVMAPKLVELIESGKKDENTINKTISEYLEKFGNISSLILGCTHFPILLDQIQKQFRGPIIDPSKEAAIQFKNYLERHPEIAQLLTKGETTRYYTTGDKQHFNLIGSKILNKQIESEYISTL